MFLMILQSAHTLRLTKQNAARKIVNRRCVTKNYRSLQWIFFDYMYHDKYGTK